MICIILNTIVLGTTWLGEPSIVQYVTERLNYVFSGIFTIEAILKLIGFGIKPYFKDGWNCFDFFIVVGTLLSIGVDLFTSLDIGS